MFTQEEEAVLKQYLTSGAISTPSPEGDGVASRSLKHLGNLPSNILNSLGGTAEGLSRIFTEEANNIDIPDAPRPFDVAPSQSLGQSASDLLLESFLPEVAGAMIPYAGVSRLAKGAGLGVLGSEIAGQAAAGAYTGIKSSPEEALKQAVIGGVLGGASMVPRSQRALPVLGLAGADAAMGYMETGDPKEAALRGLLDTVFGYLPGSPKGRGITPKGADGLTRPDNIPPGEPWYPDTNLDSILRPTNEMELKRAGFPFEVGPGGYTPEPKSLDLNLPENLPVGYGRQEDVFDITSGLVQPKHTIQTLKNDFRTSEPVVSDIIQPISPEPTGVSEIYTGPKPPRPHETFGKDLIERPELPSGVRNEQTQESLDSILNDSIPSEPNKSLVAKVREWTQLRSIDLHRPQSFEQFLQKTDPNAKVEQFYYDRNDLRNHFFPQEFQADRTRMVDSAEVWRISSGGDEIMIGRPSTGDSEIKILKTTTIKEKLRDRSTEGGQVLLPVLNSLAGGAVGAALPADDPIERANHIIAGMLLPHSAKIGRAIGERIDGGRIGALGGGPEKGKGLKFGFEETKAKIDMAKEGMLKALPDRVVMNQTGFSRKIQDAIDAVVAGEHPETVSDKLATELSWDGSPTFWGWLEHVIPKKPQKVAGISLVDSEGRELSKAPIGKTHADIKTEAMDKFYEHPENIEKDPFTSITHAFHDEDGNVLSRAEAYKVAKDNGQLNESGLRKASQPKPELESQDLIQDINQPKSKQDIAKEINDASDTQRGKPESKMLEVQQRIQSVGGPAILVNAIEHVGDLANRAGRQNAIINVQDKVRSALRDLTDNPSRWSWEKEIEEGYKSNVTHRIIMENPELKATYDKATGPELYTIYQKIQASPEFAERLVQAKKVTNDALLDYANTHKEFNQPITELGMMGKQAAIALGKQDKSGLKYQLLKIQSWLDDYAKADEDTKFEMFSKPWTNREGKPAYEGGMKKPTGADPRNAFVSLHALTTGAGAVGGGLTGYAESGGDWNTAAQWAMLGAGIGFFGYKGLEGLTRPNTRIKLEPPKKAATTLPSETYKGLKEAFTKPAKDIAGEDVHARGGIMSKFIRGMELSGRWHMPEPVKVAWTRARGVGAMVVDEVESARKALGNFIPSATTRDAAVRFIEGKLTDQKQVKNIILADGGILAKKGDARPPNHVNWKVEVGLDAKGDPIHEKYYILQSTQDKLRALEETNLRSKLTSDEDQYYKLLLTARAGINEMQGVFAESLPDGELKDLVDGTFGQYISRTYRIFTDPKYKPTDNQIKAVIDELRTHRVSKGLDYDDLELRKEVESYLQDIQKNKVLYSISGGKRNVDTTLLTEREDLTPTMRELLGEYTDPTEKILQSIARLYPTAQAGKYISLVSKMELDGLPAVLNRDEFIRQSQRLSQEITIAKSLGKDTSELETSLRRLGEYSKMPENLKYGKLSGQWVNRFIADQTVNADQMFSRFEAPIMRGINNTFKLSHTAYEPLRHIRNIITTPIFLAIGKASPESLGQAWTSLRQKSGPMYEEMISNGILTADQVIGEFKGRMEDVFNGHYDSSLQRKLRAFHEGVLEVYRFPDLAVRAATYIEAKSRFAAQAKAKGITLSPEELIQKAVAWTDERTMNYDNVAPFVKAARSIPFFNLFISYTAEMTRITKNIIKGAAKGDIGDIATLGLLGGAFEAAQAISEAQLSPEDRKQWAKAQALGPDYARSRYKLVTSKDAKGNFHYLDITPWLITDNINQMARSTARGDFAAAFKVNPIFGGENSPFFNIISEQITGKDSITQRDFRGGLDRVLSVVQEMTPSITPGIGYEWQKWGTLNQENTKTGRMETWPGLATKYITGAVHTSVNPNALQKQAIAQAKQHIANERAYLNDVLKMTNVDEAKKARAVEKYKQAVAAVLETYKNKFDQSK